MSHPDLLERATELEAIESAIAGSQEGQGRAVLFVGAAGLGKTSLLEAAAQRAEERGMRVLRARGDELEQGFPWGGTIQLFADVARDPDDGAALSGAASLAMPLFAAGIATPESFTQEAFPLLHGLHWLTANLSEQDPLLLLLDDAHWLDPETVRYLNYLLARIGELRASAVIGERSGEPTDPATGDLLARLRARPEATVRTLAPLRPASVQRLVRDELPDAGDEFCEAIGLAARGNPFLARELTAEARAEGFETAPGSPVRLRELRPEAIRHAILGRLGRLREPAGRLAAATAILGPLASPRVVAALADLDEDEAAAAVDSLVAAGILEGANPLVFVHPIVRDLVYGDLSAARRGRDHLAAARLLHESGAPAEEVASHLGLGEPVKEAWAVAALREAAGRALGRGSPRGAAHLLRRALEEAVDPDLRPEVLVELGRAELAAGEPGASDRLSEALELSPPDAGAATAAALGEAQFVSGRYHDAVEAFERGLDLLDAAPTADEVTEAVLLAGLGAASQLGMRPTERVRRRTEALIERPPEVPSPAERVLLALAVGYEILDVRLRYDRIVELARRALAGEELPEALGRTMIDPIAGALAISDELDAAIGLLDTVIEQARERGGITAYVSLLAIRSYSLLRAGRVTAALADAGDAVRIGAEELGDHPSLALAHFTLISASLDRGERDAAAQAADVPDARERWGGGALYGFFPVGAGRFELARGRPAAALAKLHEGGERLMGSRNPSMCPWRSEAALAASRAGEEDEALELADEELELARRFGAPSPIGVGLRGRALVDRSAERTIEMLRESVATLAESPAALEHARALIDLGAALRRAGWDRDSRDPLRHGLEGARECEARGLVDRAAEELAAAGATPRRLALSGVESLTPSERRIAVMAARGMSNREIAEALFVTRRTVETHLTHTYAKLKISARKELRAALRRPKEA